MLREDFEQLVRIQERWNILLNEMARDFEWYQEKLQEYEAFVALIHRMLISECY